MSPSRPAASPSVPAQRVIHIGSDEIRVTRLAPAPALRRPTVAHEAAYLAGLSDAARGGLLPGRPPEGLGRSLARAAIEDPSTAVARIRSGMVTTHTDTADVAVLRTSFSPLTVLPGEQPRGAAAGGRPTQVREPISGHDPEASRLGLRVLVFDDPAHLRAWVTDSLCRSLPRAIKRGRIHEIAATGVRRPGSASMVLLMFQNGISPQWVPMLSDGISRQAVCAAALLGQLHSDPATAATAIADQLLPVSGLTTTSTNYELARRMRSHHDTFTRQYLLHLDEGSATANDGANAVDEDGAKLRQFMTLPVDLHLLGSDPETGELRPMETALEAVVGDVHLGTDGWALDDDALHTTLRALKRMGTDVNISPELLDLCTNRADLRRTPALRSTATDHFAGGVDPEQGVVADDDETPLVDHERLLLRRAVTVMATLLGPVGYETFKTALRDVSWRQRLTVQQTVEYVAAIVCQPWAYSRPTNRSWANGGPVPTWIRETQLDPAHPADYLELVEVALDPGAPPAAVTAAQLELALAGGTALIADGVITTALVGGSGSAVTPLAFRGTVNAAVEALTRTEEGLTALAIAANHFKPSRSAQLARPPAVDLDQTDRVARDGMGIAIRTTESVIAQLAAQGETARSEPEPPPATPSEPTPLELLQRRAQHLPRDTRTLLRDIELTKTLHDQTGGPTRLSEIDLQATHQNLSEALRLVGRLT